MESIKTGFAKLEQYERKGYVFHGSPLGDLSILEPRQATDSVQKEGFNVDEAVFAAIDPAASVIFACMSMDNLPKELSNGTWSVGAYEGQNVVAKIPVKWKPFITQNRGYVYVLPGDSFVKGVLGGWQTKSKVPVKPVDRIEVEFADFEKLGGKVEWIGN